MRAAKTLACASLVTLAGCSKIYFDNGAASVSPPPPRFHHIGVLGLVEFSDPVDLKASCSERDWATVETLNTFVTALIGGVTYGMYTPWAVSVACK